MSFLSRSSFLEVLTHPSNSFKSLRNLCST